MFLSYCCLLFLAAEILLPVQGVAGSSDVRLYGGSHRCEGRVQFLLSPTGGDSTPTWLDTCSGEFGDSEAMVVCRIVGCEGGARVHQNTLGGSLIETGPTAFSFSCSGEETSLRDCQIVGVSCNVVNREGADIVAVSCNHTEIGVITTPIPTPTPTPSPSPSTESKSAIVRSSANIIMFGVLTTLLYGILQ